MIDAEARRRIARFFEFKCNTNEIATFNCFDIILEAARRSLADSPVASPSRATRASPARETGADV